LEKKDQFAYEMFVRTRMFRFLCS